MRQSTVGRSGSASSVSRTLSTSRRPSASSSAVTMQSEPIPKKRTARISDSCRWGPVTTRIGGAP